MKYHILIIEDDPIIRNELKILLKGNGYEAEALEQFDDVATSAITMRPDLILLDIKLPEENGFSICSKIRAVSNVPIIFVTSCNTDMDELNSIMLGGDAFITKPYHTAILLAKIAALLKRFYPEAKSDEYQWKDVILHPEKSTIEYNKNQIELTRNEVKVLSYLFCHAGKICSRADLIDYLWDQQCYIDDNALSVNINRIREKLKLIGLTAFIQTKHRQGYLI